MATSSVYVSPNPEVSVIDGLGEADVDFQNDISTISGKVIQLSCKCLEELHGRSCS